MRVDFKCENEKCEMLDKPVEREIPYEEIENQKCEKCGEKVRRVWAFSGGIKTSDGYKG